MQIIIRFKNLAQDSILEDYANGKIRSLEKFIKLCHTKEEWQRLKDACEVFLDIERESGHHHKGMVFRARIHTRLPGRSLEAETRGSTAKEAVDLLRNEFYDEIIKYKDRKIAVDRRRQRTAKKEFHLSSDARSYRKGRVLDEGA